MSLSCKKWLLLLHISACLSTCLHGTVVGCSEHGTQPLGSVKCKEFFDQMRNYWFLEQDSAAWCYLASQSISKSVNFLVDYLMGVFICHFNRVLCFLVTDTVSCFIRYCVTTVSTLQSVVVNVLFQCWKQVMITWWFISATWVMFRGSLLWNCNIPY